MYFNSHICKLLWDYFANGKWYINIIKYKVNQIKSNCLRLQPQSENQKKNIPWLSGRIVNK